MITRYLTSTAVAVAITAALLFVMHVLIEVSEAVETTRRIDVDLTYGRTVEDTPPEVRDEKPERVDPPPETPSLKPPEDSYIRSAPTAIRLQAGNDPTPVHDRFTLEISDNPLINIMAVRPVYPAAAARMGMDGLVIVEFDVTESGAVTNVVVIESSSRYFNQAAINAAYRFRYKARMVDGTPVVTSGIRKQFRFAMEKN